MSHLSLYFSDTPYSITSAPSTASDIASYAHEESNWSRLVVHLQRWVQYNRRSVMLTIT
eukprot:COSAG06_NODE_42508_length_381_cov_0.691489_1_plen_58_part_10